MIYFVLIMEIAFLISTTEKCQTKPSTLFNLHCVFQFQKSYMLSWHSVHGNNIDVSQSADDLACCEALARKQHKDFLLLIMGLVAKLNETVSEASLTRIDLPIMHR